MGRTVPEFPILEDAVFGPAEAVPFLQGRGFRVLFGQQSSHAAPTGLRHQLAGFPQVSPGAKLVPSVREVFLAQVKLCPDTELQTGASSWRERTIGFAGMIRSVCPIDRSGSDSAVRCMGVGLTGGGGYPLNDFPELKCRD